MVYVMYSRFRIYLVIPRLRVHGYNLTGVGPKFSGFPLENQNFRTHPEVNPAFQLYNYIYKFTHPPTPMRGARQI